MPFKRCVEDTGCDGCLSLQGVLLLRTSALNLLQVLVNSGSGEGLLPGSSISDLGAFSATRILALLAVGYRSPVLISPHRQIEHCS